MVVIVMGSELDRKVMAGAEDQLIKFGVSFETRVISAHRTPDLLAEYAQTLKSRNVKVVIAGASLSAALPGVLAAYLPTIPVIGVPIVQPDSVLGGQDALYSIVQMPPGVPVACVGINNAHNAAVMATQIMSLVYSGLVDELKKNRTEMAVKHGSV